MLRASPMLAGGGGLARLLPQDVFATSLYTGTGGAQTITNGLDLAGQGGLLWVKRRNGTNPHILMYSPPAAMSSQDTSAEGSYNQAASFLSNGFTVADTSNNPSGSTMVSWSFRRAPKFFDIVTWTGDGTTGRQIPHKLGITPGMIIIKARSATGSWAVWHRAIGASGGLSLNSTGATSTDQTTAFAVSATDALSFTLLGSGTVSATWNAPSGVTYVAYLFAHDPDTTTGIVQCVSSANSGGQNFVALPWQPQFVLSKRTDGPSDWFINDVTRGFPTSGGTPTLLADTTAAEDSSAMRVASVGPTGCYFLPVSSGAYIHLAIRAPILNLPLRPQDAFATSLYTGNGGTQTITNGLNLSGSGGLIWTKQRSGPDVGLSHDLVDTARGVSKGLVTNSTNAENADTGGSVSAFLTTGYSIGSYALVNGTSDLFASWSFVRKPKFFDVVTYTGDGTTGRQIAHSLGIAPGMVIVKARSTTGNWAVWHRGASATNNNGYLNTTAAFSTSNGDFGTGAHTATNFIVWPTLNASGQTYVAYLFAHDPDTTNGIVQCGSFTADASGNATVALGWQPQFLMVKLSSASGNWITVDTARGWASGNDAYLNPNLSSAETTTGDIGAPTATGFTVTGYPASATVVYLAIRAPTT